MDSSNVAPSQLPPTPSAKLASEQQNGAVSLAPQACQSCRRQKRKCDKRLPECGLCQRIGRSCDYTLDCGAGPTAPSTEDFAALRQQVADLQQLVRASVLSTGAPNEARDMHFEPNPDMEVNEDTNETGPFGPLPSKLIASADTSSAFNSFPKPNDFPILYFLDSSAFEGHQIKIAPLHVKVPPGALAALGNSSELRAMIELYFDSIHTYFPVVSKIRLYQYLASPFHEPGADTALLFLSMKLVCSEVSEGQSPLTPFYRDIKVLHTHVESQNGFSLQALQALLLICLYECGQGIYPAAYLSVGHAARLGYAEGIHDRQAPQMFTRASTWTEMEERRRVWWAIMILDRFVHIGHRGKPFSTIDPPQETYLPTDDSSWDRGQMLAAAPLALSASSQIDAAPFARTCQAAYLLGQIIRHLDDKSLPTDYQIEQGLQLHRTMSALADVLPKGPRDGDPLAPCTSLALCYSGMSTLYDAYMCADRAPRPLPESHIAMQHAAIAGLREVSEKIVELARHVRLFVAAIGLNRVSPLIIDCIYQAAANYAWYLRETSDPICRERIAELKEILTLLKPRWQIAAAYLEMLADYWDNERWNPQAWRC